MSVSILANGQVSLWKVRSFFDGAKKECMHDAMPKMVLLASMFMAWKAIAFSMLFFFR